MTKIVLDYEAVAEWKSQDKIIKKLHHEHLEPSKFGIFPLAIHCLSSNYVQKFLSRFKRQIPSASRYRTHQLDPNDEDNRACEIYPDKQYCGIQIKRFEKNGDKFKEEVEEKRQEIKKEISRNLTYLEKKQTRTTVETLSRFHKNKLVFFNNSVNIEIKKLYLKLKKLLEIGIYHNDIKLDNIAILDKNLVFIDWGISIVDEPGADFDSIGSNFHWIKKRVQHFSNMNKPILDFYFTYLFYFFRNNDNNLNKEYFTLSNMLRYHFMVIEMVLGDTYEDYSDFYENDLYETVEQLTKVDFEEATDFLRENWSDYARFAPEY